MWKHYRCNIKIQEQRTTVHYCCYKRCCHNRRVKSAFFCKHRQHWTYNLWQNNCCDNWQCNRQCKHKRIIAFMLIHYINSHTVYHRQYRTDYNRNSKFLEHHFKKVRKMNFIKCNTSDYKSRTLCAAVTAGIHYHRHKRNQKRYCRKCHLSVNSVDSSP